jgi:hypothetical protein
MESIDVRHQIHVQVIITEAFKKGFILELSENIERLSGQIQSMEAQKESSKILDVDRQRQKAMVEDMKGRIETVQKLAVGELYHQGTVEGVAKISVGDQLYKKISSATIVLKDGVVQEIQSSN